MNDSSQVIADLKAAKEELARRGRHMGEMVGPGGTVCARGAIGCAVIPGFAEMVNDNVRIHAFVRSERFQAAERELRRHLPDDYWVKAVWAFNDDHKTTDTDVLNLFDKALADLGGLGDE